MEGPYRIKDKNKGYIPLSEFLRDTVCPECALRYHMEMRYAVKANAIQLRCSNCDHWYGNVKYDYKEGEI